VSFLRITSIFLLISIVSACQSYTDGTSRTFGEWTDDVGIQASVKAVFLKDDEIKAMNINTEVRKGVVALYGRVPSEGARSKAIDLAGRVKGVKKVDDRLTLVAE
jgi:osmotically-inducible protein OsmY